MRGLSNRHKFKCQYILCCVNVMQLIVLMLRFICVIEEAADNAAELSVAV